MNNAEMFRKIFGIYATEFWSYSYEKMCYWLSRDVPDKNVGDTISRQAVIDKFIDGLEEIFADIRENHVDDSVCGLCEYQWGDWCNECPGFEKDDCFKLSDKIRKEWTDEIIRAVPSAEPQRKKGHLLNDPRYGCICSQCRNVIDTYHTVRYCTWCGAEFFIHDEVNGGK